MYLIFYKWYPHDLFYTSGGWHGTKIIFFVDMVLGPTLTLVLTNSNKQNSELIRDLCFCALIQVGALAYGISLLIDTKPEVLSIYDGSIYAIQNDQIANLPDKSAFTNYPNKPPLIYSDDLSRYDLSQPEFKAKAETVIEYGEKYGVPPHAVPTTFDSIGNRATELQNLTVKSLKNIQENPDYDSQALESISHENWFVVKIDGSFKDGYLAFDIHGKVKESICCH